MTRDQAFLPILMAALAVASLSLMDAFMKSAALAVGALTAAWLRSLLATGIALPLCLHAEGAGQDAKCCCSISSVRPWRPSWR